MLQKPHLRGMNCSKWLRFQANKKFENPWYFPGWLTRFNADVTSERQYFLLEVSVEASDWILNDALLPEDKIQEVVGTLEGVRGFFTGRR